MKTVTHTRIKISLSAIALACSIGISGCATTQKTTADTADSVTASFVMPRYQSATLDNGLQVKLMVQKEVPLVTIDAVVRAGAVNDITSGMAYITSQSLLLGAAGQSKADIEQQLDFIGASIDTNADLEGSYIRANMMSKDVDTVLDIFSHVLRQPDFDSAEFDKLKQREIVGLSQQKESPRAVIGRYFNKLVFGDHPYANPVSGNSDTIGKLSVEELRAFHKGYYQPS
ncbi:MAG TPA: peptidase M16, partial [Shewanella frigidimarina]|nr:peptidase M16 [Shewanella frigidimarina]